MEITSNTITDTDWENYILHGYHAQLCYHLFQILPWDNEALQYHLNRRKQLTETARSTLRKLSDITSIDEIHDWSYKIKNWTYDNQNFGGEPKSSTDILIKNFNSLVNHNIT